MPFGDRTGPQGMGPVSGRGAGYCSGFGMPGSMNTNPGGAGFGCYRSWGQGCFGRGRGRRNWYHATGLPVWARTGYGHPRGASYSAGQEIDFLRNQADFLKKQLEDIQHRISAMEKAATQES
jgi:hypothetical protein